MAKHPYAWLWDSIVGVVPPFQLEIVLTSLDRYYVHSPFKQPQPEEESRCLFIWDMKGLTEDETTQVRTDVRGPQEYLESPEDFIEKHPGLRVGMLYVEPCNIHHVVGSLFPGCTKRAGFAGYKG